jgi:hypothetical protein
MSASCLEWGRLVTCSGLVTRPKRRLPTGARDTILPHCPASGATCGAGRLDRGFVRVVVSDGA